MKSHVEGALLSLVSLLAVSTGCAAQEPPSARSFYMGTTNWPLGADRADVDKTYELAAAHGDLIGYQFNDGIPWPEAYEGRPYSAALESIIRDQLNRKPANAKLFIQVAAVNMGRDGFAGYRGEAGGMPLPAPWNTYAIDDPHMIQAYANFCVDIIGRFQPDYFNYGLESTDIILKRPEQWAAFVRFHEGVYKRIKEKYPTLPLCVSVPLKHPDLPDSAKLRDGVKLLLPYVDYLSASVYPFAFFGHPDAGNPANLPRRWLSQIQDMAGGKPVAVSETGWIAEDLVIDAYHINTKGTPEWQKEYIQRLLTEAEKMNALHVVLFDIADYDKLWQSLPEGVRDLAKLWRDTGLFNERLEPRPAVTVWDEWLKLPVANLTLSRTK